MFQDKFYLQLRGTAMGANVAPTYANIYVTNLEHNHIYVSHHARHLLAWWRYIDDVFAIWSGSESTLLDFYAFLNSMDPNIQFTLNRSTKSIEFLDTEISVVGDHLETNIYVKNTDKNTLLQFDSAHPRRMVESLPYSQLLRVKRITSSDNILNTALTEMGDKFRQRGYPKNLISSHMEKIRGLDRSTILKQSKSPSRPEKLKRIPFVSTFSEASSHIAKIIRKHWSIITCSYPNIDEFHIPPLMSYRRSANLKDRLVKSCVPGPMKGQQRYIGKPKLGGFPCLNCISCPLMQKGDTFTHPHTLEKFKINQYLTCTTDWVVYVLWCPCGLLYVGETKNDFKTRLNNHCYSIRKGRIDLPVPKHFSELQHTERDVKFMLLQHIPQPSRGGDRLTLLKKCELSWIYRLNTLKPHGLNVDFKVTNNML